MGTVCHISCQLRKEGIIPKRTSLCSSHYWTRSNKGSPVSMEPQGHFCTIVSSSYPSYRVIPDLSGKSTVSGSWAHQANHAQLWGTQPRMGERRPWRAIWYECPHLTSRAFQATAKRATGLALSGIHFLTFLVSQSLLLFLDLHTREAQSFRLMPQLTSTFAFVLGAFPTGSLCRSNPASLALARMHTHYPHRDSCAIFSNPTKTVRWLVITKVILRPLKIDGFSVVC